MLERDIEKKCIRWAERRGWWQRKFVTPARKSAPDRIFIMALEKSKFSRTVFVEFKATGKDASDLQKLEHKAMRKDGLEVYVINAIQPFKDLFTQIEGEMTRLVVNNQLHDEAEGEQLDPAPAVDFATEPMRSTPVGRKKVRGPKADAKPDAEAPAPAADDSWLD